ncbi:MAG TPA: hypothetical protein VN541_18730 [Tepidisphaeraceae bacterium]|nr:hypothetical protein [Tepidisphaeraceae bacterium]
MNERRRRNPAREHQRLVAVVKIEIVVRDQKSVQYRRALVTGATHVKEDFALVGQLLLMAIDRPRSDHEAV